MSDIRYHQHTGEYTDNPDMTGGEIVLSDEIRKDVSLYLAYLLRHDEIELPVGGKGWADLGELVNIVQEEYDQVTEKSIRGLIACQDKQRYEISAGKIRALYGHGIDVDINKDPCENPPKHLYHGTPARNVESIQGNGLQPQSRNTVHLTDDVEMALDTGNRHCQDGEPVVLFTVDATELAKDYTLTNPSGAVYTVQEVPPSLFI